MEFLFRLGTGENSGDSSVDREKLKQLEKIVNSNTQRIQNLEDQINGEDSGGSSVDGEKLNQLEKTVNSNTQKIQNNTERIQSLEDQIRIVVMKE